MQRRKKFKKVKIKRNRNQRNTRVSILKEQVRKNPCNVNYIYKYF